MSILAVTLEPFISGGVAACFASTCIHPIDLAKVRLQVSKKSKKIDFVEDVVVVVIVVVGDYNILYKIYCCSYTYMYQLAIFN